MCHPGTQTQLYFPGQRLTRKSQGGSWFFRGNNFGKFFEKSFGKPGGVKEASKKAFFVKILTLRVFHCQRQAVVINKIELIY
jgi:hypothetical protein